MNPIKSHQQQISAVFLGGLLAVSTLVTKAASVTIYKTNTPTMSSSGDWTTASGSGNFVAPAVGNIGRFDSTISAANLGALNLGGNVALDEIQFVNNLNGPATIANTGGYTLTLGSIVPAGGTYGIDMSTANANVTINCNLALGTNGNWSVGSAQTLTINGVLSGTSGGGFILVNGGTVNLNGGGALGGGTVAANYFSASYGTLNVNSGTLTVSPQYRLNVGWNASPSYLNISNATLVMSANTEMDVGAGYNGAQTSGVGVINIGGGAGTPGLFNLGTTTGTFKLGGVTGGTGSGTINLNSYGTLATVRSITANTLANSAAVNFNGGTLKLTGNQANIFGSGVTVTLNSAGGTIDCQTFSGTNAYAITGTGGLTKLGSGVLALTAANSYTGGTTVSAGKLVTPTSAQNAGTYSIADGATNNVQVSALGQSLTNNNLTLGNSTGATLEFNNVALANPTAPIIRVTNNLTLNGTVKVNVSGTSFTVGTVNLLTYSTKSGSGSWLLGSLPGGMTASLNDTGSALQLIITGVANSSFVWRGNAGNIWDPKNAGNVNWVGLPTGSAAYYTEIFGAPSVTFDDSAVGNTAITLGVQVNPTSFNITNSINNYSITGSGILGTAIGLNKNGTGTFTLGVSNKFTSATINGGTLALTGTNNVLPVAATVSFSTNGTLSLGGNSQTLASITMAVPSIVFKNNPTSAIANGVLTVTGASSFNPATTNLTATLDLSGLSGASFVNAAQTFSLNMNNPTANGTAIINLATNGVGTNFIAASTMNIGAGGTIAGATGATDFLNLGPWNTFWVSNFTMGAYRQQLETVAFQPGLTTSNLTITGSGGTNRVGYMNIGENNSGTAYDVANIIVGAGTFNCLVSNLTMGIHNISDTTAGRAPMATLDLGAAGNFDCLVLTNGQSLVNASTYAAVVWISQHGGNAHFQTMIMGDSASTTAGCNLQSPYFLYGGALYAQTIQPGNDGAGLSAASFRGFNWTNGTIRNYNSSTPLTITANGSTVPVTISAPGSGNRFFVVDPGLTNTVNAPINQFSGAATPVVMSGPGTLDLQGTMDNPYFQLNVSNGVVLLDKQSTTTPSVHAIGSGLAVNGGTVILAGNGGTGGDQIYDGNLVTLNSGTLDLNGQTETIGGLAGTGGTLADASGGSATLTVNVATGTNYISGVTLNHGNLVIGLATAGGTGKETLIGSDNRVTEMTVINSGTLQIGNGSTGGNLAGSGVTVNSPGFLAFNNSGTLNFAGSISGNGSVAQNGSGRLTLAGSVTYTGNTLVNAGTLAVATGATTIGGSASVITVAAGATFDVTGGAGNFAVQSGQLLTGAGTLTGSYSVASGATNSGTLTVNGNLTLQDGSVLDPGATFAAGTIAVNGNLIFGGGAPEVIYNLAALPTPGGGTNSLLAIAGNLDLSALSASSLQLFIHGTPASGSYTLATFGGNFVGSVSAIQIVGSSRYTYTPQIVGKSLVLVVAGNGGNLVWGGDGVNNTWDANDAGNLEWLNTSTSLTDFFNTGDNVTFNDSAVNSTVNVTGDLLPASLTISNAAINFTFANGGGAIDGPVALNKTGSGSLTIQNNNTFSGPVNLNGGVVSVANVDLNANPQPLGAGTTLVFNGGTFQYTGTAVPVNGTAPAFNKQISLGAGGGTFDQSGSAYFFLTNQISGTGSFTKAGAAQLIIGDIATGAGNNSYSGITYVTNGEVQLRNTNALGSVSGKTVVSGTGDVAAGGGLNGTILEPFDLSGVGSGTGALQANDAGTAVNFAGNITLVTDAGIGGGTAFSVSGNIAGVGSLTKLGNNTVTLLNTNSYTGGTVIATGTLQLGNNSTNGWLPAQPSGVSITNNGTLVFNREDTNVLTDSITGTGTLVQNGSGLTILGGSNTFTGNVTINGTTNGGALLVTNAAALGGGAVGVNGGNGLGVLQLAGNLEIANHFTLGQKAFLNGNGSQVQPPHISSLAGTNSLLGTITVGAGGNYWGFNAVAGLLNLSAISSIAGGFPRPIYLEGSGNGAITNITDTTANYLQVDKYGTGTWTIYGSADVPQGLQVTAGELIVDTGATINEDSNGNMASTVSGGKLLVNGSLAGNVTVNGGLLGGAGAVAGSVKINLGGSLWPGCYGGIKTFIVNNNLTSSGSLVFSVDKSQAQSNDLVVVSGFLTNAAAGTLTVTNINYLTPLAVGDTFTLFSQAVSNGAALTIVGGGSSVTWSNNLAVDGSITVLSVTPPMIVNPNPFLLTNSVANNILNLSWPADRKGWRLQVQTNSLNAGLQHVWFDWPNATNVTSVTIPLNPANPSVFLRMVYP